MSSKQIFRPANFKVKTERVELHGLKLSPCVKDL